MAEGLFRKAPVEGAASSQDMDSLLPAPPCQDLASTDAGAFVKVAEAEPFYGNRLCLRRPSPLPFLRGRSTSLLRQLGQLLLDLLAGIPQDLNDLGWHRLEDSLSSRGR